MDKRPRYSVADMIGEAVLHWQPNEAPIKTLYVFMSLDKEGNGGIMSHILPGLGSTPLITGSARVAEKMKPLAQAIADRAHGHAALFRFERGDLLWEVDGHG